MLGFNCYWVLKVRKRIMDFIVGLLEFIEDFRGSKWWLVYF